MKIFIKFLATGLILIAITGSLTAQDKVKKVITESFEVTGVCKMCKARIENAALIKGVKMAEWDKEAQKLKVVYNTTKTSIETIQKAIADIGHDTEKIKANDANYSKLPGCCQYRDGVKVH